MTVTTLAPSAAGSDLQAPRGVVHDTWVIAKRGLVHMKRQPEALSDATIQPIMFVLLFGFVFGGAIAVPGEGDYREFLMGGIFAQTIAFTAFGVAMSIANDFKNQAVDRFRSLPLARGAVLGGHAVANLLKTVLPIVLMSLTGLLVGWRINGTLAEAVGAYLLMLVFSFAMIWVGVLIGSVVRTPEGVTGIGFVVLFPLTFLSSAFVPTESMPTALRTVAQWNPVSTLADSIRVLFDNPHTPAGPDAPLPLQHPVAYTLVWAIGIVLVCAPLAVRAYDRSIAR